MTGGPPPESDWTHPVGYDREIIRRVWRLGQRVQGNDEEIWRKDEFGAWIYQAGYGNRRSEFGWEIADLSSGGNDGAVFSLRPIQWQNYVDLMAARTQIRVTAEGLRNIKRLL